MPVQFDLLADLSSDGGEMQISAAVPIEDFIKIRPAGGFGLIMADPPWLFEVRSEAGIDKSPQAQYECQDLDWIKSLPVSALAAEDCLLWLWATWPMLPQALEVIEAWGFEFKTGGDWVKRTESGKLTFGTGYLLRSSSEPYLLATRGSPKTTKSTRSTIEGLRRAHSEKPEEAFKAAEALMPDAQRLELFSRRTRPGWSAWGDQVGLLNDKEKPNG